MVAIEVNGKKKKCPGCGSTKQWRVIDSINVKKKQTTFWQCTSCQTLITTEAAAERAGESSTSGNKVLSIVSPSGKTASGGDGHAG